MKLLFLWSPRASGKRSSIEALCYMDPRLTYQDQCRLTTLCQSYPLTAATSPSRDGGRISSCVTGYKLVLSLLVHRPVYQSGSVTDCDAVPGLEDGSAVLTGESTTCTRVVLISRMTWMTCPLLSKWVSLVTVG